MKLAAAIIILVVGTGAGFGLYTSSKAHDRAIAVALTGGNPDRAPALLRRYGCSGCHTIPTLPDADGKVAPPLGQLRKRVYIGGKLENTPANLVQWIVSPQRFAPGSAMPDSGISEDEARDVAAFLYMD